MSSYDATLRQLVSGKNGDRLLVSLDDDYPATRRLSITNFRTTGHSPSVRTKRDIAGQFINPLFPVFDASERRSMYNESDFQIYD